MTHSADDCDRIADPFITLYDDVVAGKMMSPPGRYSLELLSGAGSYRLASMYKKKLRLVISFTAALSFVFGAALMSAMAASEATASISAEQSAMADSLDDSLLATICPSHNGGGCFNCAQTLQITVSATVVSGQDVARTDYPSGRTRVPSWIRGIDPGPPKTSSFI